MITFHGALEFFNILRYYPGRGGHRRVLLFVGMVSFLVHLFVLQLTDFSGQHENDTMCADRSSHQRVYLKNTPNTTKEPSSSRTRFACRSSSLQAQRRTRRESKASTLRGNHHLQYGNIPDTSKPCSPNARMNQPMGCATIYTHQMKWPQFFAHCIWVAAASGHATVSPAREQ
jgi:hypothetical protein